MFNDKSDITAELQQQIDQAANAGGGEVIIPPGTFYFKPIELKSNICLRLSAGSKLIASGNRSDYFPIGYHHNEMGEVHSAIYALDQTNITINGEGIIDLNGQAFYYMDKPTPVTSTGAEITQAHLDEAPRSYDWRVNQPIFFHQCKNIRINDVTIIDSPCWTVIFNFCEMVKVNHITIRNSMVIPNSDGLHFTCSKDIFVSGCHITAGDDCIALSSITDWQTACEHVVISDCILQSASKALSIGYMHSVIRNVLIENVLVKKSNRAFVSMCHPHTGLVENIRVTNCIFEGRSYGGNWWGNGEALVLMVTPHHIPAYRDPLPEPRFETCIKNVGFSNILCIAERPVGIIASEPLIKNISLKDITIQIVPETRPSLKGNVIDLAPGPENLKIPNPAIGVVLKNVHARLENVLDEKGQPIEVFEIDQH